MADKSPVILDFTKLWNSTTDLNFGDSSSPNDVSVTIAAVYDLKAQANITAAYDSNVFRGAICERQAKFESSRLVGESAQGKFEPALMLGTAISSLTETANLIARKYSGTYESGKLIGANKSIVFEQSKFIANKLTSSFEFLQLVGANKSIKTEALRLVGKHRSILTESMVFVGLKQQYKAETGKLISKQLTAEYKSALFTAYALEVMAEAAKIPPWLLIEKPIDPVGPETNPVSIFSVIIS